MPHFEELFAQVHGQSAAPGGAAVWGDITGTLADQLDLQAALDALAPGAAFVEFPAAVALGGHRAVRLLAGEAVYADSDDVADANLVLGITTGAVGAGIAARIQTGGLLTEPSWAWTPDAPVFCSTVGTLTQTPPAVGFSLIVGIATSPTQIFIGAKMPIVL